MKNINYIVIVIFVGILVLVNSRVIVAESAAQTIELKYGYILILDRDRHVAITKRGGVNLYKSKWHIIRHYPRDSILVKNAKGEVFIISKEDSTFLGMYKEIIKY